MGIPDHLICLLRNLYVGQEVTVRTLYATTDWFRIEKQVQPDCLLSPCLFNLHEEHIMHNTRLDELQGGIKIARKNNNFKYADDTTLMAEIKEELKSLLMRVKEESEKGILKLNNKKTKIMASSPITSGIQPHHIRHPAPSHQASSPITSRKIEGEKVEAVTGFLFLGSEITVDGDCSHGIRIWLLLGRKSMTNLCSVLKSKDITLPIKVLIVKGTVFPAVMYGCESWIPKKAECQRIGASELWCWRRLLRVPWTARRSNQSILKEINPEYSLEGLRLKLKIQYFGHLMRRADSFEKTLMLGKLKAEGMVGWHHWFYEHDLGQNLGDGEGQGSLACRSPWDHKELDMTEWTTVTTSTGNRYIAGRCSKNPLSWRLICVFQKVNCNRIRKTRKRKTN